MSEQLLGLFAFSGLIFFCWTSFHKVLNRQKCLVLLSPQNPKQQQRRCVFDAFDCLTPLQVKVWFQNRRMKWKRVKGGQQGALAREKELVNVKKGTLLPSEFSGIAALHHSTDSLANEDSHDSDQSSEHAHL